MRVSILVLLASLSLCLQAETLKIATGEYPPWTTESLPHYGYINHIVEQAFKAEGIEVEFHFMPWKRALEATRLGHFHASSYWGDIAERRPVFYHSDVLHTESFVFFHRKALSPLSWKKLTDLSQYAIGATRGYTYTAEFWNMTNQDQLRVSVADDDVTNLRRLVDGEIDLFPISHETGKYLLKQHFTAEQAALVDVNLEPLNLNEDFILFSRQIPNNEKYLEAFNRGLKKLQRENKLAPIRKAYLE